ncbi:YaiO family outer membrane beta-barrel protein [Flavisolibacter sp. BT320]|nr:YaiO family outer membrane beta-barrel protein [Flavisolibacter longurius]
MGQRENGRDLALRILEKNPLYLDVKTFVGRTYAWDGDFEKARAVFATVAAADARTLDNYIAWIDAERWAREEASALTVAEKALSYFPDEPELLFRKARLLANTGKMADAKLVVQKLLRKTPKHKEAYVLLQDLRSQLLDNEIAAGFSYEGFSDYFSPAQFAFIQGSRATPLGSVIGRINYTNRLGKQAIQPEIDIYPKLGRNIYAYLNAGFSDGSLFSRQRYGAEIFASLPRSFEASAGLRHLSFGPESKVTIYTGSVGYYTGNYWLSLRPYITPGDAATSVSASATIRRYFSNPEHYFSVRIGAGFSPELLNTQTTSGFGTKDFYTLRSQSVAIGYQYPLSRKWALNGNIIVGRQETMVDIGRYTANTAAALTVKYRYR